MEYSQQVLGDHIRNQRQKRNITIEQLAELVDISPSFLGLVERGQRGLSIDKLCKVADVFNLSVDSLLFPTSDIQCPCSLIKCMDPDSDRSIYFEQILTLTSNFSQDNFEFLIEFIKLMNTNLLTIK
ncbi:helix-turn-helix transcriptional regulator [Wukongibacter baidiensis]|uniref:helix-turn-helix domain-containing protein n=1 Tax=Wukongibacter baidiensis TaxID=1723361 RepID=UPI003D7FF7F3